MSRFFALSRTTHGLLDIAAPAFCALLWLGGFPPWQAADAQRGTRMFCTIELNDAETIVAAGCARPWTMSTAYAPFAWHCAHCSTPPTVWLGAWTWTKPLAWQPRHAAWMGGVDGSPAAWADVPAWRIVGFSFATVAGASAGTESTR